MHFRAPLIVGSSLIALSSPLRAQEARPLTQPAEDTYDGETEDGAIVITGEKPRGAALGDMAPLEVLDSRDIRATGATNINELLEALAPQLGSAQGRGGERPILLLNGKKISGFRELRAIPTEAIERVDILPEEVALKYGYAASQKVVNVVLRQRFRSTAAALTANAATEGGYAGGNADVTRLAINRDGRMTINLRAEGNGMLTEAERKIRVDMLPPGQELDDALAARSLVGSKRLVRGSATVNRTLWGDVSATFNAEVEHSEGRSLIGLGNVLIDPLGRRNRGDSGHVGFALNGAKSEWQWSLVGNGDLSRSTSRADRDDLIFDRDRTRQLTASGDLTASANGQLFKLPAGDVSATLTVAADAVRLSSERERAGVRDSGALRRSEARAAVNIDMPISRRNRDFSALGSFTVSTNAELRQLSDFGTLTKFGANAFLSPLDRLNFLASWSREDGAPSVGQLGDPLLETPDSRIFDFLTGETVLATLITGGNPGLDSDRRTVTKLGANWQPLEKLDLRLRADYVRSRVDRPVQSIFGPTQAIEAAFPDRFVRNSAGQLVSADLRPVNFDTARKETLRIGFDFTKPLKSRRPAQGVLDQLRAQFRGAGGRDSPPPAPATGAPPPSAEGPRHWSEARGSGRGGGFFGGGSRGRLTFSLTDTITLRDEVSIGRGLPVLDFLDGEASSAGGGTPRHRVEVQAGWANDGFGARLSGNWQSRTTVRGRAGDELRFAPLASVDVRLFANPGERPEWVLKHPWLRGTSARLEVKNLFDAKPKVRDLAGGTPINYQSDLLDPLGRTLMFTARKLFSPSPASIRREYERERSGEPR